jgi:hypothetical protein
VETTIKTTNAAGEEVTYDYGDRYNDPNRGRDRRKKVDGTKRGYQVAEMYDKHHEIARRLLLGQKGVDIAKALGCTEVSVSQVKNSPVVQEKLTIMRAARDCGAIDLAQEIAKMAPIALGRIKEALDTGKVLGKECSAAEILKQGNHLLDREIGKAVQKVETKNLHGHFSMEDIKKIKDRAKELAPPIDVGTGTHG